VVCSILHALFQRHYHFHIVHVTAYEPDKSLHFHTAVKIIGHAYFPIICQYVLILLKVKDLERFQAAAVTFKVSQGHWYWCNSTGHIMISCSSSIVTMPLSCAIYKILSLIYRYFKRPCDPKHNTFRVIYHSQHQYIYQN